MVAEIQKHENSFLGTNLHQDMSKFVDDTLVPILSKAEHDPEVSTDGAKAFDLPLFRSMFAFIAIFSVVQWLMPNTALGEIANFIAFPILFLGTMAAMVFLYRHRIAEAMLKGRDNFLIRSEALVALCSHLGLEYVPLPGGPSKPIKLMAGWRYCPEILKDFYALMDDHGGFDDVADTIRQSGLALPREVILGSEENRQDIYDGQIESQQFQDGIKGVIDSIPFSALEWTERSDDDSRHHLLIVLKLPTKLMGRVEFKNKKGRWPPAMPKWKKQPVSLISKAFTRAYNVRACDQVEARLIFDPAVIDRLTDYAASDAVCGIAFDEHLVVDLVGRNRFDLINLATGAWSQDTIQTTLDDIAELLGFVRTVSRAFAVKPLTQQVQHIPL